ncbi:MAG: TetR/AcrR family transcriptional regulator [Leadbetterella sp.]
MKKSELTKYSILHGASLLFHKQGYKVTSMSEIEKATGYTKGAIYNYFSSKEQLEFEAFEHLMQIVISSTSTHIAKQNNVFDKIDAFAESFLNRLKDDNFKYGCPLLKASLEFSDHNSIMQEKLVYYLNIFKNTIIQIIQNGIKHGQLKEDTPAEKLGIIFFTSLQGAIVLSKVNNSTHDFKTLIETLKSIIILHKN